MFTLPSLSYAYGALEPYIDAQTMEIHYTKHHQAYLDKLNAALQGHPELEALSITELLKGIKQVPEEIRAAVQNHGGGHANHSLFWSILGGQAQSQPEGALGEQIAESFGNFETFQQKFSDAAATRFGSGWAWLVVTADKKLAVYNTPNQDSPLMQGDTPILGLDVWEHAYYLKYQNRRPDYVAAFWSIVNWNEVERLYVAAHS
ncbi:superoxide dismutase [Candidatus Woesebacteria bacterium]|nr:superoxide dismutase [Candidatus Woesebacteria bacterium]